MIVVGTKLRHRVSNDIWVVSDSRKHFTTIVCTTEIGFFAKKGESKDMKNDVLLKYFSVL